MRGSAVMFSCSRETITAAARVPASFALYFGLARNAISPARAFSSEPTCRITVCGLPATRPPRREAISPSVNGPGMASFGRRLAGFQRPDYLVGDVDAGAEVDDILHDQVVLFL